MLDGKIDYQQLKLICVSGLSGRVSEIRIPMISYVQNETSPWFHMVPVPSIGFSPPATSELPSCVLTQPGGRHCECGQRQLGSHGLEDLVPSPGVAGAADD